MKILMFGWEFPPEISGGLGTACFGIANNLSSIKDVDLTFIVPKNKGLKPKKYELIDASSVSIQSVLQNPSFKYFEVNSKLIPYVSAEQYWEVQKNIQVKNYHLVATKNNDKIDFKGNYTTNLFDEVFNYSIAAHQIAEETNFDLIHAHDWMSIPAGIEAKRISKKPFILHLHSTEFDRSSEYMNPSIYSLEKEGMLAADKIITVSETTKKLVVEKYGIDQNKIECVYNGIEKLIIKNVQPVSKRFSDKIVTFLGRVTHQKGPEIFVKIAHRILLKDKNVRFVMAGDGDLLPKIVKMVAKLGISNKFHFTGFLGPNQVAQLLSISDVYVLPSVSEPFGITVLEAIQAGVPVVASSNAGVCEVIENVVKISPNRSLEMATAIQKLLQQPIQAQNMANKAKKELKSRTWKSSTEKIELLYQALLNPSKA